MTQFGSIKTGGEVEHAVQDTLATWMTTYLRELERQLGLAEGLIPTIRSYQLATELDHFNEDQLPACVVVSPGLAGIPVRRGDGVYYAAWSVAVAVVASANDAQNTSDLVRIYGAAIRAILLQKSDLGNISRDVDWIDESYDDLPTIDSRTLGVVMSEFHVWVEDVVVQGRGPAAPSDDPGDLPVVQDPRAHIEMEEKTS